MKNIFFPSIRGNIGDWIYYTSVMPIQEISERVKFVEDIHATNVLSELLQRDVVNRRITEISDYLAQTEQRFFNSLVLAIYDTLPVWHPASVEATVSSKKVSKVNGEVGLLEFNGNEQIIPIDGQHRLAGIKNLIERYESQEIRESENYPFLEDIIPVIFIAHRRDSEANFLRIRRLFTTLNKYAVKVNKHEIIAIDEDDPMAITTRWLVENDPRFCVGRIKIKGGANISVEDECFTSIENIYDVLSLLFVKVLNIGSHKSLTTNKRPTEEALLFFRKQALIFFDCLADYSPEVKEVFAASDSDYGRVALKARKSGHVLFRPIGLKLITNLIARMGQVSIGERFDKLKKIPMNMKSMPYRKLLISEHDKMQDSNEPKVRNILLASLGIKLTAAEKNSAKTGIAIITGHNRNKILTSHLPTKISELKDIENIEV